MHTAYLNIGSNIGDRRGNIAAAVAAIKERLDAGAAVMFRHSPSRTTPTAAMTCA